MRIKVLLSAVVISVLCIFVCDINAYGVDNKDDVFEEIYEDQFKISGADGLYDNLPSDAEQKINLLGVREIKWSDILSIKAEKVFAVVLSGLKDKSPKPFKSCGCIIGVILLTALCVSVKRSECKNPLGEIIDIIGCLGICVSGLAPIIEFISKTMYMLQNASKFILCYIPVMSGIMVATGQPTSAASYNVLMLGTCEVISQVASNLLVPILCMLLAVAVVSSISPRLNLSLIYDLFHFSTKWILGLVMTIFTGLLSIQSIVGNSVDTSGGKAVKFMISSFVPVVGSALGDAFGTVQSCVKLLKSGVGAFGILGAGFIFLPIILEALLWMLVLNLSACIGKIFELDKIFKLLNNTSKVISLLLSIVLCCMTVLIVSTVIVLVVGNSSV